MRDEWGTGTVLSVVPEPMYAEEDSHVRLPAESIVAFEARELWNRDGIVGCHIECGEEENPVVERGLPPEGGVYPRLFSLLSSHRVR